MQIPILIERIESNGYRASGGEPLAFSADGTTQEEALANLKAKLHDRLRGGGIVVLSNSRLSSIASPSSWACSRAIR